MVLFFSSHRGVSHAVETAFEWSYYGQVKSVYEFARSEFSGNPKEMGDERVEVEQFEVIEDPFAKARRKEKPDSMAVGGSVTEAIRLASGMM